MEGQITQEMLDNTIARLEAESDAVAARAMLPLQGVRIIGVNSQTSFENYGGWETIYNGQFTTKINHGGDFMYVYTEMMGYARRYGEMNGNSVYSALTEEGLHAYYDYWDLSGYQSGRFELHAQNLGIGPDYSAGINIL